MRIARFVIGIASAARLTEAVLHPRDESGRAPLYEREAGNAGRQEYLVLFHESYTFAQHEIFVGRNLSQADGFRDFDALGGYAAMLDDHTITELVRKDPGVKLIERNDEWEIGHFHGTRDFQHGEFDDFSATHEERAADPWRTVKVEDTNYGLVMVAGGHTKLRTPVTRGTYSYYSGPGLAGDNVDVYVVDSGIRTSHILFKRLGASLSRAKNFQGKTTSPYTDPPGLTAEDQVGHGTRVAGVIGAFRFGVAQQTTLINVKVTKGKTRTGTVASVIHALNDIVKEHNQKKRHGPVFRGSVVNLSLAAPSFSFLFEKAVNAAYDAGIALVAGAGNVNKNAGETYPCAFSNVICVGAVNENYQKWELSNYGSVVDIQAPGDDILAPDWPEDYATQRTSGTSIAAPFITGIIAIYMGWESVCTHNAGALMKLRLTQNQLKGAVTGFNKQTTTNFGLTGVGNLFKPRGAPYVNAPTKRGASCGQGELKLSEAEVLDVAAPAAVTQIRTFITTTVTKSYSLTTVSGDPSYDITIVPSSSTALCNGTAITLSSSVYVC